MMFQNSSLSALDLFANNIRSMRLSDSRLPTGLHSGVCWCWCVMMMGDGRSAGGGRWVRVGVWGGGRERCAKSIRSETFEFLS